LYLLECDIQKYERSEIVSANILVAIMGITACVVCAGIINTYVLSTAKKTLLLAFYAAAASIMLFWPIVKLLEIVSPTAEIRTVYVNIQFVIALLFVVVLLGFVVSMYLKKIFSHQVLIALLMGVVLIMVITKLYFVYQHILISTGILLAMLMGINLTIFFNRFKIFPEMEISLDNIVENVKDRVAVFDLHGTLIDKNLRALENTLIPTSNIALEFFVEQINTFAKQSVLEINKIRSLEDDSYENEVCIEMAGQLTYYIFTASALKNKRSEKVGTVCTLRDITENKLISLELDQKNKDLKSLNLELENYISLADSLAEEKERAQIAREINSTIGQKLTEILSVLEVIKLTGQEDAAIFEKPLNEAIASCREVLAEIRVVVSRLIPDKHQGVK
jgi:signal transduction histidine kinase